MEGVIKKRMGRGKERKRGKIVEEDGRLERKRKRAGMWIGREEGGRSKREEENIALLTSNQTHHLNPRDKSRCTPAS